MTNSAKRDTAKAPAETARTESTESAATELGGTAPEAAPGEDTVQPELDETKRKFREALERKQQVHSDSQGNSGRDGSKINGAHGPAASRRNFRRKSG